MKNRILLTVIALVILPTALLSILAGRSVRNRELVIMEQMRLSAESMTRLCSEEIESGIKDELARIKSAIGAVLMRTASAAELAKTAQGIEENSSIVDGVLVYHDPWDVIYPPPSRALALAEAEAPQPPFIDLLRIEIAQNRDGQQMLTVNDKGVYYCFTLIPGRKDLYAGFKVNLLGFRDTLDKAMLKLATDEIILTARGRMYSDEDTVIIEDSLTPKAAREQAAPDALEDRAAPLAERALGRPFTDVVVAAYTRNPTQLEETGRNQEKLLAWGILLLSGGIVAGVIILIFQVHEEIRRTSARANYIIGISHDLRTPIASLKMMTESLYSGTVKNPEKRHRFLGTMSGECERLNRLVERVLYFVRFGEDALVFFKKTVNLKPLLDETIKSFSESSAGARPDVTFELQAAANIPEIEADDNAISQVLLNLFDNSLKYGRANEGKQSIKVSAEVIERKRSFMHPTKTWVRISVADDGPGINPSELGKIFKPYFRAKSAYNANSSGVGLGLALCRHIARAHNGWIEAANKKPRGAVFSLYLPVPE